MIQQGISKQGSGCQESFSAHLNQHNVIRLDIQEKYLNFLSFKDGTMVIC